MREPLGFAGGTTLNQTHSYDIAIVGMAGRFPRAQSPDELWDRIRDGENCISLFTEEQLRSQGVKDSYLKNPNYVSAAPVLQDIELFDASFFGLTPREAEITDPQQRLFFECCWEALENAGYDPHTYGEAIGVFAGSRTNTYLPAILSHPGMAESIGMFHLGLGNDLAFLTSRVSHFMNLRGPSCSVHTACSTSLVAVHLACQSLLLDECRMALAGGIAVNVPHITGYMYEEGSVQSPDGYCRPLGAAARGTVFGSGVGVVVLKWLDDALADRDFIHAVIRGTAVNNDGSAKASFTAPSIQGQVRVIKEALLNAGVSGDSISYVECHGTGTLLGDAIELRALTKAMGKGPPRTCALGSIKSNMGHLDAAAGIVSFMKVVLSLEHKMLPPSLHFSEPNPQVNFSGTPFYVNTDLQPWKRADAPLRAGVSAFGVGGTNAHVVLEEAPEPAPTEAGRTLHLLTISARTRSALDSTKMRLADHLRRHTDQDLADVAYTLQVGRRRFACRNTFVVHTREEAIEALSRTTDLPVEEQSLEDAEPAIAFLFPDLGSEYAGMGRELIQEEPVFAEHLKRCSEILQPFFNRDLIELLSNPAIREGTGHGQKHTPAAAPVLFALQYSLAQLWMSWGIQPGAMLGHGLGEYTAACLAGVMTLEEALSLMVMRDQLMQKAQPSAIGAISNSCLSELRKVQLRPPSIPFISTLTGTWIRKEEAQDLAYWLRQLQGPALLDEAFQELLSDFGRVLLEIGPGHTLRQLALRQPEMQPENALFSMPESAHDSESQALLQALGQLWKAGAIIDWSGFHARRHRRRIPLPTYPFERKRYWIDPRHEPLSAQNASKEGLHGAPKLADISTWFWIPSWKLVPPPTGSKTQPATGGAWLVFLDDCSMAESICSGLQQDHYQVVRVYRGDAFQQRDKTAMVINPTRPSDYVTLMDAIAEENKPVVGLLNLWGVSPTEVRHKVNGFARLPLVSELEVLLYAVQALLSKDSASSCQIVTIGSDLLQIESGDSVIPEKTGILAVTRVIPQEHPNLLCRVIDIVRPENEAESSHIAGQILADLRSEAREPVVGFRGRNRWITSFERILLDSKAQQKRNLQEEGAYLILGGLGTVGLFVAELLARIAKAKLVLVSRSKMPPREEWNTALEITSDPIMAHRLRMLLEIENSSAHAELLSADISDPGQMEEVLEHCYRTFGRLDGIIHAAGVTSGPSAFSPIRELKKDAFEAQARAKIEGIHLLEKLLPDRKDVGFVLLISSNSTVVGGVGFAAYAAGNAFLDSYVGTRSRRDDGPAWICTNWDHWPEVIKKTEASYTDVAYTSLSESAILNALELKHRYAMSREEAQEAILRILTSFAAGQVFVATGDLAQRVDQQQHSVSGELGLELVASSNQKNPRPDLRNVYVAPENETEREVAHVWEEVLGLEKVGIHDDFFELGGHSLLATKLVAQLRNHFGGDITLAKLFEGPTVAQIAASIDGTVIQASANVA